MKVIVTGSNSVIGQHLCKKLSGLGVDVLMLGGRTSDLWKLGEILPSHIKADVLIHLAHDRASSLSENVKNGYLLCNSFVGKRFFFRHFRLIPRLSLNMGGLSLVLRKCFWRQAALFCVQVMFMVRKD